MKRALLILAALFLFGLCLVAGAALAQTFTNTTREVVLDGGIVQITLAPGTVAFELQNNGGSAIKCGMGPDAGNPSAYLKRVIEASGGTWSTSLADTRYRPLLFCSSPSADQVAGAGTTVSEVGGRQ